MKINIDEFHLLIEKDSNVAYLVSYHSGDCVEGIIKDLRTIQELTKEDTKDVIVSGIFEIMLNEHPATLIEQNPTVISAMAELTHQNQIALSLDNREQKEENKMKNTETSQNTTETPLFKYFNVEQYEEARAKSKKVNPRREGGLKVEGLSRKLSKKWQNERRKYEEIKGYETMFPSEHKSSEPHKEEQSSETAQQETKKTSDEATEKAILNQGDEKEETVDIKKEYESPKLVEDLPEKQLKEWSLGAQNLNGRFKDCWDGYVIASKDTTDNTYTIAQTRMNQNGFAYYLLFPKSKTAEYVFEHLMKHPGMSAQLQGSKISRIDEILDISEQEHQCAIIHNGKNYISAL